MREIFLFFVKFRKDIFIESLVLDHFAEAVEEVEAKTGVAELSAILSAETGKTRLEAIGEVEEAADIIKHYTRLMTENDGYHSQLKSSET